MQLNRNKLKKQLRDKRRDSFHIETGDNLAVLRRLNPNQFDAMVTDPPAGISFMGKDWDGDKGSRDEWIRWLATTMAECMRVLKPGAHALVWAIPRTQHWTMMALENAGFEIRDVVYHLFGQGFPKSHDISKAIDKAAGAEREVIGKGQYADKGRTAGVKTNSLGAYSASENDVVTAPATPEAKKWSGWGSALKPACEPWILVQKPLGENTIAANILKHGTGGLNIEGSRIGDEVMDKMASTGVRADTIEKCLSGRYLEKKVGTVIGRYPANIIFDDHEISFLPETARNFFYIAKPSTREKNAGADNIHPTVKPIALMKYLITLITPPGGTVLDPFMGSGTTGVAAIKSGFKFFGIDQDASYTEIARKRLFAVYKVDPKTVKTIKSKEHGQVTKVR